MNDTKVNCPICAWTSDNRDYLFLYETVYWRICLAPNQSLLGRCVIHLKRHVGDLANLSQDEMIDFLSVIRDVEHALATAFNASMFNWSCYMNHSYREEYPDPHVHWWAVPRYKQSVMLESTVFEDPHFGNPYDHNRWLDVSDSLRLKIAEKITTNLNSIE